MIMHEQRGRKKFLREAWVVSKGREQIRFWDVSFFPPLDWLIVDFKEAFHFLLHSLNDDVVRGRLLIVDVVAVVLNRWWLLLLMLLLVVVIVVD